MNKSTIFHGPWPFSKGWFRDSIAFVWSFPSTHWWAVKMLTKMRWWQRMGKSRGKGPKRRVTSPATFPKTFLSIISWSFQNTSTFLYSKFWTISAHCASGGEETCRESHPSASASIPICTDPRVWALRRRRRWRNFLWKQCSGSSLQMYCVVVHYKTAAAAAAVEEHQTVLYQKQTQLPKTTCKLEAALRQPLGRLNRRPPAEKLLSTSSSFTTYIFST